MYTPKWSTHIFDEWKDVMRRKGVSEVEADKRMQKANLAFPDALVTNYAGLIEGLNLPDEKDCHVLAAAIKTNANILLRIISGIFRRIIWHPLDYLLKLRMIS